MINYHRRRTALRKILQRSGTSMKTADIHTALCKWFDDFSLHGKTTLRDLEALTETELVAVGEKGPDKKAKYWKSGRESFDLTLSPTEAMTLAAIFEHAQRFGFNAHTEQLGELREYAASEMTKHSARPWPGPNASPAARGLPCSSRASTTPRTWPRFKRRSSKTCPWK